MSCKCGACFDCIERVVLDEFIERVKKKMKSEMGESALLTGNYRFIMNVNGILDQTKKEMIKE